MSPFLLGKKEMQDLVTTIVIAVDLIASVVIQGMIYSAGIVEGGQQFSIDEPSFSCE